MPVYNLPREAVMPVYNLPGEAVMPVYKYQPIGTLTRCLLIGRSKTTQCLCNVLLDCLQQYVLKYTKIFFLNLTYRNWGVSYTPVRPIYLQK